MLPIICSLLFVEPLVGTELDAETEGAGNEDADDFTQAPLTQEEPASHGSEIVCALFFESQ